MKAKLSLYNAIYGILSQVIIITLGIFIPRLVLINYGSEINGLLSALNQVFLYLGLLEAGVGTATLSALYGSINKNIKAPTNEVMSATNRYYKKAGYYYISAVIIFSIIFPLFISTSISKPTIIGLVLLSGTSGAINFLFQGKYSLLLQAEGKNYIITNLGTIIHLFSSISKIILLQLHYSVIIIQLVHFIINSMQTIYMIYYIRKNYKWLDLSVKPNYGAISQKNSAFVHQLSNLVFHNTDVLLLTIFCGLKFVSVYSMYTMLFSIIATFIATINNSVTFILGQTFNSNRQQYLSLHDAYEIYNMCLTFSLYCVASIFIIPFVRLYTSGVTDINYIENQLPYMFIATYLLSNGRSSSQKVILFAGHFKQTQNRSIIESVINLFISIVLVSRFKIYGVLFGTIIALIYRTNDIILYANGVILKRTSWSTYRRWLVNTLLFVLISVVSSHISLDLSSYWKIISWASIYTLLIVSIFFIASSLIEPKITKYVFLLINDIKRPKKQLST